MLKTSIGRSSSLQPIYTKRLQIREFTNGDLEPFVHFMLDPDSTAFMAFTREQKSYEGSKRLLEATIESYRSDRPMLAFAVEEQCSQKFVGFCGLSSQCDISDSGRSDLRTMGDLRSARSSTAVGCGLIGRCDMDLAFVLIHGGGFDTWIWDRITPLLDFPALAVHRAASGTNLSRLTIADSAKYIQSQIESAGFGRTILVAHSIGGILAPPVATLLPQRVAHMVFVGANIPPEGSSAISIFRPSERFGIAVWLRLMAWKISFMNKAVEEDMRKTLCNDMDEATVRQILAGGKNPEPPSIFYEPVSRLQMPSVPCTYIKLLQDRGILPPSKQDEMAANIGAKILTLNTGHTAMLSRPHELAELLNGIASEMTAK